MHALSDAELSSALAMFESKIFKYDVKADRGFLIYEGFRGLDAKDIKEMYLEGLKQSFFTLGFVLNYAERLRNEKFQAIKNEVTKEIDVLFKKVEFFLDSLTKKEVVEDLRHGKILLQDFKMNDQPFFTKKELRILRTCVGHKNLSYALFLTDESKEAVIDYVLHERVQNDPSIQALITSNQETLHDYTG